MTITLTRYLQNRTFTFGKLTFEGSDITFDTLERSIPRDRYSYVKHCLPPGQYPIRVESSLLTINQGSIRKPWLILEKVKWFPSASILSNFANTIPPSGAIHIGLGTPDEWSIIQNDIVTAKIVNILTPIYNEQQDCSTEPVILQIIESPDIIVNDYDQRQHEADLAAIEERKRLEEAEQHLYQLMNEAMEGGVIV